MVHGGARWCIFIYIYIFWQCFILSKAEIDRVQTHVSWQKRLLLYILRERNMLSMWLYWIYGRYLCNLLPTRLLFKPYITFHHRPGVPYFIIHDTTQSLKSLLERRFILKVSEMPSIFHTLISMLNSYILKMIVFADIKEMKPFQYQGLCL